MEHVTVSHDIFKAAILLGKEFLDMAPFTLINIPALPVATTRQDEELVFCFEAFRAASYEDPYESFEKAMQDSKLICAMST